MKYVTAIALQEDGYNSFRGQHWKQETAGVKMDNCPKCNAKSNSIAGPRYHRNSHTGQEVLQYMCTNCGYSETRPCADAHARKE